MQELDDNALLREYVEHASEEAFATLVARHVNKVYSVALRQTGNPHQAEEITQAVFVIFARKSRQLAGHVLLSGWLYQAARLTAVTHIRSEIRRTRREQEAYMQTTQEDHELEAWAQIAPLLEAAMAGLNATDRHAIVMRFFDGKSIPEVGAALGANEAAARKRVDRALDKLHCFLSKRGVRSTTAIIAGAISTNSVQAAPAMLAKTATTVALAKGAAASGSTLPLIKTTLKLMAWTKAKTTVVVGVSVLLAATTTTVVLKEFRSQSIEKVFKHASDGRYLEQAPPVVILRPARYPGNGVNHMHGPPFSVVSERFLGLGQPFGSVLSVAYDIDPGRIVLLQDIPGGTFEFLDAIPNDPKGALRAEIKKQFGVVAHRVIQNHDALILRVSRPNAPGLQISRSDTIDGGSSAGVGSLKVTNLRMSGMIAMLGRDAAGAPVLRTNLDNSIVRIFSGIYLGTPVVDETGLTNTYDFELHWDAKPAGSDREKAAINKALHDQLGLELVPTNLPVEMLVVEKTAN